VARIEPSAALPVRALGDIDSRVIARDPALRDPRLAGTGPVIGNPKLGACGTGQFFPEADSRFRFWRLKAASAFPGNLPPCAGAN